MRSFLMSLILFGVVSVIGCTSSPGMRIRWMNVRDDRLHVLVDTHRILHLWGEPTKYDGHRYYEVIYPLAGLEDANRIEATRIEECVGEPPMHSPGRAMALRKLRAGETRHLPTHAPRIAIEINGVDLVASKVIENTDSRLMITRGEMVTHSIQVPADVDGSWSLDAWDVRFQRLLWWDGSDDFRIGAWHYESGRIRAVDFTLDLRRLFVQVWDRFELSTTGRELLVR